MTLLTDELLERLDPDNGYVGGDLPTDGDEWTGVGGGLEVAAGRPFDRALGAGEAARIFTGGVIPQGADAVVICAATPSNDPVQLAGELARDRAHAPGRSAEPRGPRVPLGR